MQRGSTIPALSNKRLQLALHASHRLPLFGDVWGAVDVVATH
jgi:hypothetical protein